MYDNHRKSLHTSHEYKTLDSRVKRTVRHATHSDITVNPKHAVTEPFISSSTISGGKKYSEKVLFYYSVHIHVSEYDLETSVYACRSNGR